MDSADAEIFVVEDDETLAKVLAEAVTGFGFKVALFHSGEEVKQALSSRQPRLILSDTNMPNGNGVELLRFVKKSFKDIPVILFMSGISPVSEKKATAEGASAILQKPVDLDDLENIIKRVLDVGTVVARKSIRFNTKEGQDLRIDVPQLAKVTAVVNVSRGGMFLEIQEDALPQVGAQLEIKLEDSLLCTKLQCNVRWQRTEASQSGPRGVGLQFNKSNVDAMKIINKLIIDSNVRHLTFEKAGVKKNPCVLVVDDETDLIEFLSHELKDAGFSVISAEDGLSALEMVIDFLPDIVLSDISMPQCNGKELLARLRQMHPTQPAFIFMTGNADIAIYEVTHKGASDILLKPHEIDDLIVSLEKAISGIQEADHYAEKDLCLNIADVAFGHGGFSAPNSGQKFKVDDVIVVELLGEGCSYSCQVRVKWIEAEKFCYSGYEFLSFQRGGLQQLNAALDFLNRPEFIPAPWLEAGFIQPVKNAV